MSKGEPLPSSGSEGQWGPGAHNGQRGGRQCEMKREEGEAAGLLGPQAHPSVKPVRPARRDKTPCAGFPGTDSAEEAWLALPHWQPLLFELGQGSQNSCKPRGGMYNIP